MPCLVRRMYRDDISQVTEIDRESFPNMWPPANYNRELEIGLAHYIVASKTDETTRIPDIVTVTEVPFPYYSGPIQSLSKHESLTRNRNSSHGDRQHIVGFAGIWLLADEGHITNIAVRGKYRRQGIGEQLLISLLKMAVKQDTHSVVLEVRLSNDIAQKLYIKYGFRELHIRPKYYTDNKEDALVMGAGDISSNKFQEWLSHLEKLHAAKWGIRPSNIIPEKNT